jgi:ribosomal protein L31E
MEEKASFSYWREGAGKPPQKLKMRVPAWERKASFSLMHAFVYVGEKAFIFT